MSSIFVAENWIFLMVESHSGNHFLPYPVSVVTAFFSLVAVAY
jgi:hypothetical protein